MRSEDLATLLPGIEPDLHPGLLLRAARDRSRDVLYDIRLLADAALTSRADPGLLWGQGCLWGPFWKGHPFGGPSLFNDIWLHEPQITRELAAWLSRPAMDGSNRAACFLRALMDETADDSGNWNDDIRNASITVEAEKDPTSTGRRHPRQASRSNGALDLLFTLATPCGELRHVVVEVKCEAPLGKGQLSAYRRATRRLSHTRYVLLARERLPQLARNTEWRFCAWRGLLARWETLLAISGDDDRVFSLFRSELFRRFS